jgi:hypothetical protein
MSTLLLKEKERLNEQFIEDASLFTFLFGPATANKQGKRTNERQEIYIERSRVEVVAGCSGVELANQKKLVNNNAHYRGRIGLHIRLGRPRLSDILQSVFRRRAAVVKQKCQKGHAQKNISESDQDSLFSGSEILPNAIELFPD